MRVQIWNINYNKIKKTYLQSSNIMEEEIQTTVNRYKLKYI